MTNASKRVLSLLVVAVMVISMIPATVFASGYDLSAMTDREIVDLVMQLQKDGNWEAIKDIEEQLDEDRLASVSALYDAQQEAVPGAIADSTPATVTAYKQVSYATNKVVDAKYFEAVGTYTDLEGAAAAIGANGGLIEISAGTLVVTNRQDISAANIIIKGAGKTATTITGNATNFNNSSNGLKSSNLSSEYKAILGLHGENIKVMDLTVDAGSCGCTSGWLVKTPADLKTVRVNSGTSYFENVQISGKTVRSNFSLGTSSTTSVVTACKLTVDDPTYYLGYGSATEKNNGSKISPIDSYLGGSVVGSTDNLGEGYYKLEYMGVVAYTTIPYAIECYESGTFDSMLNSSLVDSGVTVVEAMTNDLTTITTTGTPKLLYGYDCAEMRQLAAEFKTALLGLASDAEVDATAYLTKLTAALAIQNWHTVNAEGVCAHCGATGLEVPTPEVEVEIPSVEEILPEDATEEEKEVVETVVEQIKQNTSLEGFAPNNLAAGSTLSIKLTAVNVGGAAAPQKFTYDVKPVAANGTVTAPTGFVTFRLPIPASVTKTLASVYHNGTLMGTYPIRGTDNGKYVEVTTDSFSEFTVEPENAPDATVSVMDPMLLTPGGHDYMCWPNGDTTIDRPLQIVMNFKANETLEECLAGKFSKYLVDFYLKVEGLSGETITTDGCYLAGNYGSFGWVVIPAEGIVMEEGVSYPIVSAYDATLNYKDICKSVKDFTAAIYISKEILTANPNFKVTLELRMTNPDDSTNVLTVGEPVTYTVADLTAGMEFLGDCQEVNGNIDDVNTNTTIESGKHDEEINAAKDTLLGIFTREEVEKAETDVVISFVKMDYVENNAPAKIVYTVTPMVKVGNYEHKISTFAQPVTFRLPVSANETCKAAKVYHEGELMGTYAIKEENGAKFVEVSSKNFSTFIVEPVAAFNAVAQVGDIYYTNLQDALNAGGNIVLLADIELTEGLTIPAGKTVVLDLNGYTISQTKKQTEGYQMILNDGNLTINDSVGTGKISYTDSGNGGEYISDTIYNRGVLVINGGTIENLSSATVAYNGYPHAVDNYSGIRNTSVTINGGTIYCAEYSAIRMFCVSAQYKADLVIAGGTIKGAVDMQNGTTTAALGTLNISGGTFETTANVNNIRFANWNGGAQTYGITATITGGNFNGGISTAYVPAAANFNKGIISGGTFTSDLSEYVADGFELVENANGTYGVEVDPAFGKVAQIGNTYYATLQDAIDAAEAGDVIIIVADLADVAVIVDKNLTITGTVTLNNVSINANGAKELTVSGLTFTGNSWINSGTAEKLTVSSVIANVKPSNTAYTNSRSAFISLGRSEAQKLALTVKNCNIVAQGGADPILGWAQITEATISGNTFGSATAYQTSSDSVKFMAIADGAVFNITDNTVYSNWNGIVFAQNTTRNNAYTVYLDGNTFVGGADHIWIEISGGNTVNAKIEATSNNTVNGNALTVADIKYYSDVIKNWNGYAGVDVTKNAEGKLTGGSFLLAPSEDTLAEGYEAVKNSDGTYGVQEEPQSYLVMINGVGYETLDAAINAAKAMTGVVTIEIYGKVEYTSASPVLGGSATQIKFVGMTDDAEICLTRNDSNGYIAGNGSVAVSYENLILSKPQGNYAYDIGFMNCMFTTYGVSSVTYTNCTFPNGTAAAYGSDATYIGCTFGRSHDRYSMYVYGDVDATIVDCYFDNDRGIKLYDEGKAHLASVTVKNTDFSKVTAKPAIVLTSAKSVTLGGNTYSASGVFELDLDGNPNGTTVNSTDKLVCRNDNGACGVMVDGKIYTTVAQAATVAVEGSTVVLLHESTEIVELPEGVVLDRNGFTAAGVTVYEPVVIYVAEVNGTKYESLQDAFNAGGNVVLLADVELTEGLTIPAGKTVVLDLNGYTISQTKYQTAAYQMILNDGNLTINDSVGTGKISYTDSGNGGEYISDTIYNRGVLVINGGTIENLSSATVARNGYPHAVDNYSGIRNTSVTINGGTIYCAEYSAIRMFCVSAQYKADLVINNGTIKGAVDMQNGSATAALGTLTITGGTFETTANANNIRFANWNGGAQTYGITATITGGNFHGGISTAYVPAAANFNKGIISGGTFTSDLSEYVADGFELVEDANGTYGVEVDPAYGKVAQIGDTYYATLADAIANAKANDTIVLLQDVTVNEALVVPVGAIITLDLNGKTLTGAATSSDRHIYVIHNYGTLTIKGNGTITGRGIYNGYDGVNVYATAVMTIEEGVNIYAVDTNGGYAVGNYATLTINGGTIKAWEDDPSDPAVSGNYDATALYNAGTATINGGTIISTTNFTYAVTTSGTLTVNGGYIKGRGGIAVNAGTATINGGTICNDIDNASTGHAVYVSSGKVIITNGAFTATNDANDGNTTVYVENGAVAEISGGTFTTNNYTKAPYGKENGTITISGGTFDKAIAEKYCAEGFQPVDNGDGTYGVEEDPAYGKVARIGDTYYATLADAIANAKANDTIVLLQDVTVNEALVVPVGAIITLDLNGKTLTGEPTEAKAFEVIKNNGNLTITGNGKIVCDYKLAGSTSYAANTITNCGTLVIENGVIENKSTAAYQIGYAIDNNSTSYNATVTIKGGEVKASGSYYYDAIRLFCNSTTAENTVTVTGGKVSTIWMQNPSDGATEKDTKDVKGAVIIAGGEVDGLYLEPSTSFNAAVTGGQIGKIEYFTSSEGRDLTGFVTGGTFDSDVSDFVADGYEVVDNGDGTYGVKVEEKPSASISFDSAAVLFKEEIKIKFYLNVLGITGDKIPNGGLEIWSADVYDPANLSNPTQVLTGLTANGSLYQICTNGIAAKNMGDTFYLRAFIEVDGEKIYTKVIPYSAVEYCKYHIETAAKDPTNARKMADAKLCISLMNYGAEAQKYFGGYETLMNSFITAEQQRWVDSSAYGDATAVKKVPATEWTPADTNTIKLTYTSAVFKGALQLKLYAKIGTAGNVKMYYWTEATAGERLLIENAAEMTDVGINGTEYQGYITGIAAKNSGDTIYMCAAVEIDGVTHYTMAYAYSIHKYCAESIEYQDDMAELAETLLIYSNVAKEYMATYNPQE